MNSYIFYQSDFLIIENYPLERYSLWTWSGRLTVEKLEQGLQATTRVFREEKILRIIGDNRLIKAPLRAEEQFMREVFSPSMIREGLERMAVIMEENVFARVIIRKVIEDKISVPTKYFSDLDKGRVWIMQNE